MLALALIVLITAQQDSALERTAERARLRAERATRRAAAAESASAARREAALRAMTDAYADSGAADLVARARARRDRNERLVTAYQVDVTQRIGVGIRALRRDRMLFGQELAAHIEWQRDGPTRVEVRGARQRIPIALRGDQVPDDLDASVQWLVIDPSADYLRLAGDDADGFAHPLRESSEADYRFASGDTTTLTLPRGQVLRLLELRVRPRRADFMLMSGSLWFDADSYGLVRAVFAPARPFDIELDGDSGDADDIPAIAKPIRAEVRYVTLEYGLYELRWWMPRFFAMDLEAQASVIKVPMRFERVYEGYRVQGGSEPVAGARRPAGSIRRRERDTTETMTPDSLARAIERCVRRQVDSANAEARRRRNEGGIRVRVSVGEGRYRRGCWREFNRDDRWAIEVVMPADTASLLASPALGEPILQMGDVINEAELRQLGREIGAIPQQPWQLRRRLPDGVGAILKNARYNRVEALSLGADAQVDFGRLSLDGLVRIGLADREPNFELGLTRPARNARFRLGGYRRLAAANPDTRPFSSLNSFGALFMQRDDGEYFRTLGAEVTMEAGAGWLSGRLFGERQKAAGVHTQFSVPHVFDDSSLFRPNIVAQPASQVGAALTVRGGRVLSAAIRTGGEVTVDGSAGTFAFGRASAAGRAAITGAGPFAVALEAGAGTSSGGLPVQSRFFLGGPATLRGYAGGVLNGESFWRGRMEIGTQLPAARLTLFSDAAWAGPRSDFMTGKPLWSIGTGLSLLDGIIRLDLARRIRSPRGWRFDIYLDGVL